MAKDVSGQPWVFDATAQGEGSFSDATGRVFDSIFPYIRRVRVVNGAAAGACIIKESSTGRTIVQTAVIDPDSSEVVEVFDNVLGIYIDTLAAGAKVFIYHGDQEEVS